MNSTQGLGQPPQQDPMAILNEASAIRDGTAQLERDIQRIKQLSQQSLNDPDTSSNTPTNRQLNALQAETLNFSQNLTDRIGRLRGKRDYNLPQNKSQVDGVKRSLEKVVQNYSSVVAECDRKMKEQIARQVRIVQPEATEQQIEDAANGREQVFASAVSPSISSD